MSQENEQVLSKEEMKEREAIFDEIRKHFQAVVEIANKHHGKEMVSIFLSAAMQGVEGEDGKPTSQIIGTVGGISKQVVDSLLATMDRNDDIRNIIIGTSMIYLTQNGMDVMQVQQTTINELPEYFQHDADIMGAVVFDRNTGEIKTLDGNELPTDIKEALSLFLKNDTKEATDKKVPDSSGENNQSIYN